MPDLFADRLIQAIRRHQAPICVGIDPILELMPDSVTENARGNPNDIEASIDAVFAFTIEALKIIAPHVPCVKFQSAYFEQFLWEGVESYFSLVQEAEERNLLVIGDVKRGDIGSTATAYAAAHLADPPYQEMDDIVFPDAITVNPMLGMDTLEPFIKTAIDYGKGLFVLVRTSNPGSGVLQDVKLADGRTWSEMLADELATVAGRSGLVGSSGYSAIGAVVGATQPQTMQSLRQRLPQSIFLLPGYGAQGATAQMTRAAFKDDGQGALVSASRSILYAHREPRYQEKFGNNWQKCMEQAILDMKQDIRQVLQG